MHCTVQQGFVCSHVHLLLKWYYALSPVCTEGISHGGSFEKRKTKESHPTRLDATTQSDEVSMIQLNQIKCERKYDEMSAQNMKDLLV